MPTNEMQVLTAITTAATTVADYQRLKMGIGSPSNPKPTSIQMLRLFATGVLGSGADITPTNATGKIVLKRGGKRLWQTTITISTLTSQTTLADADADAEDDEAVCSVTTTEDTRGFLDLLGAFISSDGDNISGSDDTDNLSWWIGIDAMGGYKSIQLYAVPGRRV